MRSGQSLSAGEAGIALLHIERAHTDVEAWAQVKALLADAVVDGASVALDAGLFFGAPALSFVLHGATDLPGIGRAIATVDAGTAAVTRQRLETAHRRIDRCERPLFAEFDLIGGLTGLGVALRRSGNVDLLHEVLLYLVRLTEPLGELPGWWCPTGPNRRRPGPVGGHGNNGIAHGITGPLALLALALLDGVEAAGHADAIRRICHWLDAWEQKTDYGSWWPEIVTIDDLCQGGTSQSGPLRPSWCYGTPGMARAQQLAARALNDPARQNNAEAAFTGCINDPQQLDRVVDRGLCHGTAGVLATARRLAADALTPIPVAPLEELHQHMAPDADEPPGLLDGHVGVALAASAAVVTGWDACLLLS